MNKEKVYQNIYEMINNGLFLDKYIELTEDIDFKKSSYEEYDNTMKLLENKAADIFNSILIGCQLFDDKERITRFVNEFSFYLNDYTLERNIEDYGISKEEALERLKHGYGVHFTTKKICDKIKEDKVLSGYGKNSLFTEEENMIIDQAAQEQKQNNPTAEERLNYLYKGWGVGVSSYGSLTNGFWMYHTPESLSFLFGNIYKRNKDDSMMFVSEQISALSPENKKRTYDVMNNLYDKLIGEDQEVGCILIERDAFEYEVDYYYTTGEPVAVERRPYSTSFNSLMAIDEKINVDIEINNLKFLEIPTVLELERRKEQKLQNENSNQFI